MAWALRLLDQPDHQAHDPDVRGGLAALLAGAEEDNSSRISNTIFRSLPRFLCEPIGHAKSTYRRHHPGTHWAMDEADGSQFEGEWHWSF
jgi:hypothetical protein